MLFFPPLLAGLAVFLLLRLVGAEAQDAPTPAPLAVQVMVAAPAPYAASATGFGRVEAERDWRAIAQVEGRVAALAPGFAVGSRLTEGDMVVTFDTRDYEIAKAKAEANIAAAEASLRELEVEEANTRRLLEIEQRIETVRETDLQRQVELERRGTAAQASLDAAERDLLAQQKAVRTLENTLAVIPSQRASLEATLQTRRVELEDAERDLANTVIAAPFDARAAEVDVAEGQYVRVGEVMARLEALATAEVVAEFQPAALRDVILTQSAERLRAVLTQPDSAAAGARLVALGFSAEVIGRVGEERFIWPAEIVRMTGRVDDATGAIGLVVRIPEPSRPDLRTRRPPLSVGAFVEVRLVAPETELLLTPRAAIRTEAGADPFVYSVDEAGTLRRSAVRLGPIFEDRVVLLDGVEPGARIILSEVSPAVIGAPVTAVER